MKRWPRKLIKPKFVGLLDQFLRCARQLEGGYAEAAYEALGLTARNLYPHLVPAVNRQLSEMGEDLRGYFWHGVAGNFTSHRRMPCLTATPGGVEDDIRGAAGRNRQAQCLSGPGRGL
jgi:hypothetical protein